MSGINEIISEIKAAFQGDTDIADFCTSQYGKEVYIKTGELNITDIPIKQMPIVVISDSYDEHEKRRFLFSDKEANLIITCGVLQNDMEKAESELISLKELIKLALKKDPLLNGKASYSIITKSKRLRVVLHPLYFIELTMYINYKGA
jgi:hypothetical protein